MCEQSSMKEVQNLEGIWWMKSEGLTEAGLGRTFYALQWALFLMSFVYLLTEFSH